MQHLLLQRAQLGDIAAHRQNDGSTLQLEGAAGDLHVADLAVAPPHLELQPIDEVPLGQLGVHPLALNGVEPGRECGGLLADDLLSLPADHLTELLVAVDNRAVRLAQGDRPGKELENAPEDLLRRAQLLLAANGFGDVLDGADHEHGFSRPVLFQIAHAVHPANRPVARPDDAVAPVEAGPGRDHLLLQVLVHLRAVFGVNEVEPPRDVTLKIG